MNIVIDARMSDEQRRAALYAGSVLVYSPRKASLDLLRDVEKAAGPDGSRGAADALAKMREERPDDTTILFALYTVPIGIGLGLGLAVLAHQKLKGIAIFRTIVGWAATTASTSLTISA